MLRLELLRLRRALRFAFLVRYAGLKTLLLLRDGGFLSIYSKGELTNPPLLFLDFAVLFKELVEQHRVHCVVAHAIDFAIASASHQIGAYLFYILGNQIRSRLDASVQSPLCIGNSPA